MTLASADRPAVHAAMEMTGLWKSQNDFHRPLEISHKTRDFHIPTADSVVRRPETKDKDQTKSRLTVRLDIRPTSRAR
jgi:hypothetical protein